MVRVFVVCSVQSVCCLVLVPGVLLNMTLSPGSSPTLTCKVQSQQSSLDLVWARREEPATRLLPTVSHPLLLIGNHLYKVGEAHQPTSPPLEIIFNIFSGSCLHLD